MTDANHQMTCLVKAFLTGLWTWQSGWSLWRCRIGDRHGQRPWPEESRTQSADVEPAKVRCFAGSAQYCRYLQVTICQPVWYCLVVPQLSLKSEMTFKSNQTVRRFLREASKKKRTTHRRRTWPRMVWWCRTPAVCPFVISLQVNQQGSADTPMLMTEDYFRYLQVLRRHKLYKGLATTGTQCLHVPSYVQRAGHLPNSRVGAFQHPQLGGVHWWVLQEQCICSACCAKKNHISYRIKACHEPVWWTLMD